VIPIASLWLPILLSAVGVFVVSSLIHMVFGYHNSDYSKLPGEDDVMASMREAGVRPGTYCFPRAESHKDLGLPEMQEKFKQGPVGFATVIPSGVPAMGRQLVLWFLYSLLAGVCVAYVAGRTMPAGSTYLAVFRVVGTIAFLAYGFAHLSDSIWKGQSWGIGLKNLLDAFFYGSVTGGVFGWLWP
jgi:Flp pilus assembly protein TadB